MASAEEASQSVIILLVTNLFKMFATNGPSPRAGFSEGQAGWVRPEPERDYREAKV
jgi:hypothetical protein